MLRHLEKVGIDDSRLARVVPSITSCAIAWFAFSCYYLVTDRTPNGIHCAFQACLAIACVWVAKNNPHLRDFCGKFSVLAIVAGLTIESYLTGMASSMGPMFYSAGVLISMIALGKRFALKILVLSVLLIPLIYFVFPLVLPPTAGPQPLDRMLGYFTLLGIIAFCTSVEESTTEAYAQRLESTTQDLKDHAEALDRIVGVDALTLLPNRRNFQGEMLKLLQTCPPDLGVALLLIDLDDFKLINDRHGHAAGDQVLRMFSSQLHDAFNGVAKLYRIGGDEFVAVVSGTLAELPRIIDETGETVFSILKSVSDFDNRRLSRLGGSIGAALFPQHARLLDDLISFADKAMYEAKAGKRHKNRNSIVVFEERMAREIEQERQLDEALDRAIQNEEFVLFYQPQVDVATNLIVGVEALIRWRRDGEIVSPYHFVSALEHSGKIVEVGTWVLRAACEQLAKWRSQGLNIDVSVNISVLQLQQSTFADLVLDTLKEFELPATVLDLEVTESLLVETGDCVHENIERLADHQVRFSIDDFGTGYSSLSHLKRLLVHRLKIDRSFIKDIPDADDGAIASTVIALANQLSLTVVAEGVETPAQLQFIRDRGCNVFQGFLFSKPIPEDELTKMLELQFQTENQQAAPGIRLDASAWQTDAKTGSVS